MYIKPRLITKHLVMLGICLSPVFLSGCSGPSERIAANAKPSLSKELSIGLTNTLNRTRTDELIILSHAQITSKVSDFNFKAFKILLDGQEIPSQASDSDNDGTADQVIFTAGFKASETRTITLRYASEGEWDNSYPKRTQAELSIRVGGTRVDGNFEGGTYQDISAQEHPKDHIPGDRQFRYEGPGWESDKVAYRLYFDHRNAIDIFGKKIPDMVLQNVGHDGYSYHQESDWGLDILKVGDSLGLGSLGMRADGQTHRISTADEMAVIIAENGVVRSQVRIDHKGWKIAGATHDISSTLSIHAGSRLTQNSIQVTGAPENLVTGIVKHQPSEYLTSKETDSRWGYIATFGAQSYVHDNLGMAIFYKKSDVIEILEDKLNHMVTLKPDNGSLDYYFLAAWQQEPGGIQTRSEFRAYLDFTAKRLSFPIQITYK